MKDAGIPQLSHACIEARSTAQAGGPAQAVPAVDAGKVSGRFRAAAAGFWLRIFFFITQHAPWFARLARRPFVWLAMRFSRAIRIGTRANGRRILGEDASAGELRRFGRGVVGSFYDFVCDVGKSQRMSPPQLVARIESVVGREKYLAARASGRGAILLTAHIGSFEAAAAALLGFEKKIHVVFKRDVGRFEQSRMAMRRRLGVIEQAVDDGWDMWMRLRDALRSDEVVAIQGDRVMPGQKGRRMPFLGGSMLLPNGPVKLAIASGAPIIPVFSVRLADGRIRLFIEDAIDVQDSEAAMGRVAGVLAKYVAAYPQQWLMLHPAFVEDAPAVSEVQA